MTDERYFDGADLDLFGVYWPVALLATFVAIIWLHVALIGKQQRGRGDPPPDNQDGQMMLRLRTHRDC